MYKIFEVVGQATRHDFVSFPNKLYVGCHQYVPALFSDEKKLLSPKTNPYERLWESKFFLCKKDGKLVGRIAVMVSREPVDGKIEARFGRFDFVDDYVVAKLLFAEAKNFAMQKGVSSIVGPLGFCDLDSGGLVVSGFEHRVTIGSDYHYDYYKKIYKKLGMKKLYGYNEYKIFIRQRNERLERVSALVQKRSRVVDLCDSGKVADVVKQYKAEICEILNECYGHLKGYVQLSTDEFYSLVSGYMPMLDKRYISVLQNSEGKIVAFGVMLPSISDSLKKYNGKINVLSDISILKAVRKPKVLELALIAVHPSCRASGIVSVVMNKFNTNVLEEKIEHLESNLQLEDNQEIHNMFKDFERVNHRNRSIFVSEIR